MFTQETHDELKVKAGEYANKLRDEMRNRGVAEDTITSLGVLTEEIGEILAVITQDHHQIPGTRVET